MSVIKLMLLLVAVVAIHGCQTRPETPAEAEAHFQSVLEAYVASSTKMRGAMLHVEAPRFAISWQGATGIDDWQQETPLVPLQPFRIASVTKTFVAATVLRLVEQDLLSLEDPIDQYISKAHRDILARDGYELTAITVRHLLNHTSGLFDYAAGNAVYADLVRANPQHRWTRTEQLQHAVKHGDKVGRPGAQYHYSDTGYILLGEMLTFVADTTLGAVIREALDFSGRGMSGTWLESLEPAIPGHLPLVHQYYEGIDTYHFDPSMDLYGGGGLVSTTREVALFFHDLFTGDVFQDPVMLDYMLTSATITDTGQQSNGPPVHFPAQHQVDYRLGVEVVDLFGEKIYTHSGFWGILAAYVPAYEAAIVIHIPNGYPGDYLLKKVVLALASIEAAEE